MRRVLTVAVVLLAARAGVVRAEHDMASREAAQLLPGLGSHHHPIATRSAEAQRFFDQGLRLVYAFNHDEAVRAFRRAAELDPRATMPHWGIALALGPNINLDVDPERERAAYDAVQAARAHARRAPAIEREYVDALAKRYSKDPKADLHALAVEYEDAMGALARRHPDDLDAATLYAESAMDLHPWKLWSADVTPAEGTEEIVAVLEGVLRRDPSHPGANHHLIHALEALPHPERALPSAARLETLAPGAGHLVHMPAHIYVRTGDCAAAVRSNAAAIEADRRYFGDAGPQGMYGLMYYTHNFHFRAFAASMAGRDGEAKQAADDLAVVVPGLRSMPAPDPASLGMAETLVWTPLWAGLRAGRWADVLAVEEPDAPLSGARALRHFARGVAFASTGRPQEARAERAALGTARDAVAVDRRLGLNSARDVLELAVHVLDARIAAAAGGPGGSIAAWRRAVAVQDRLAYTEPPDWYYPVRESLGAALLAARRPAEAEAVFRTDLARNPRNPRSLFGLAEGLAAEGRTADAALVRAEVTTAWRDADHPLRMKDL